MKLRYRLLVGLCHLLRHPDHTVTYADGSSRTSCSCGFIDVSLRSFVGNAEANRG